MLFRSENMWDMSKTDILLRIGYPNPMLHGEPQLKAIYDSPMATSKFRLNIVQDYRMPIRMSKYSLGGFGLEFRLCSFGVGYTATFKIILKGLKAGLPLKLIWKKCKAK